MAGVFAALIGVHGDWSGGVSTPDSHKQDIQNQFLCYAGLPRPADYSSGIQINNYRQVKPTLMSSYMRDVRDLGFIGRGRTELMF